MSGLVKKVVRPLVGGALGFLVGGPAGAAVGIQGGAVAGAALGAAAGYASGAKPPAMADTGAEARTDAILDRQEADAASERARLMKEQQARSRAARRGGIRSLLSNQRLTPETGLQTTLGPS